MNLSTVAGLGLVVAAVVGHPVWIVPVIITLLAVVVVVIGYL